MPQRPDSFSTRSTRRLVAVAFIVSLLSALFAGANVGAQRSRPARPANKTQPTAQATPSGTQKATPSGTQKQSGRLTPLRTSDTGSGSRVTITSDSPLNDYSAYRSGDRYYVVVPKADANALKNGVRGRGFEDAQVQKRGDDVVLSFRLQPGASARVDQKFNRLNIEFAAPDTPNANAATNTKPVNQTSTNAGDARKNNAAANPNQTAVAASTPNATAPRVPVETANKQPNETAGANTPPTILNAPLGEPGQPATLPTPATTVETPVATATPASEQLAQLQQPAPPVSAVTTKTVAPAAQTGTSIGAAILRNWPLALIAALLLVGVGLFFATRRTSVAQPELAPVETKTPIAATTSAKLTSASTATAQPTATSPATAGATAATLSSGVSSSTSDAASTAALAGTIAGASALAGAASPAADAGETQETILSGALDAERVQEETKKLLKGERYNESVIGVSDIGMRELVSAELLAALAGRNVERRDRARKAFVHYGYLDDAARNLQTASAPAERASAARALGLSGERAATPHLVRALGDTSAEVRRAGVEALAEVRDPAAVEPLKALQKREKNQKHKVPRTLIQRAIEASAAGAAVVAIQTATEATPTATEATPEQSTPDTTLETTPVVVAATPDTTTTAVADVAEPAALIEPASDETPTLVPHAGATPTLVAQTEETPTQVTQSEEAAPAVADAPASVPVVAGAAALALAAAELRRTQEAKADEEARVAEEARLAEESRRAEETRRAAEEARAAEELRLAGEARAAEELRLAEESRIAEEQRLAEETRVAEAARLEAERRAAEKARIAGELRRAEEARVAEQSRRAAEAARLAEEKRLAAEAHLAEESRVAEAARRAEELRLAEESRLADEARRAEEARIAEETRRATEEARRAEEARLAEEARVRLAEETRRREEEARAAEEAHAAEEARVAEETRRAEEARLAEEARAVAVVAPVVDSAGVVESEPQAFEFEPLPVEATEFETHVETAIDVSPIQPVAGFESTQHEEASSDWIELDMNEPEAAHDATASEAFAPHVETTRSMPPVSTDETTSTTSDIETWSGATPNAATGGEFAPASFDPDETPTLVTAASRQAVPTRGGDKGVDLFDEGLSTVPKSIQERLASDESGERVTAIELLSRLDTNDAFEQICAAFDDEEGEVRDAAARSLFNMKEDRAESFTRALRESAPVRRRNIGASIASSGLAEESISRLTGQSREKTYESFSLLFLMAKAGEVQPLIKAIESHPDNEVRLAVVKLLALSGQQDILPAFRRLAVRGSLPTEVRSAVMEAIYQISSSQPAPDPTHAS